MFPTCITCIQYSLAHSIFQLKQIMINLSFEINLNSQNNHKCSNILSAQRLTWLSQNNLLIFFSNILYSKKNQHFSSRQTLKLQFIFPQIQFVYFLKKNLYYYLKLHFIKAIENITLISNYSILQFLIENYFLEIKTGKGIAV